MISGSQVAINNMAQAGELSEACQWIYVISIGLMLSALLIVALWKAVGIFAKHRYCNHCGYEFKAFGITTNCPRCGNNEVNK